MRVESGVAQAGTQGACPQAGGTGEEAAGQPGLAAANESARRRRWVLALVLGFGLIAAVYLLLWSPWWYPLSDSSLYISVARNMDEGRGYTYMGRPHRMVMPLTPAMLWGLLQFSRSFGLMNASMIACMLGSFLFMYLALKEWTDRRAALGLTVVSALTYWQFHLASIVMSEQPYVLLLWIGLYLLARARRRPERRFLLLTLAAVSLLLGVGFRAAGGLMIPVIALALWLDYRGLMSGWRRVLLAGAVVLPMAAALGVYDLMQIREAAFKPRESVPVPRKPTAAAASQEGADHVSQIVRYIPRARIVAGGVSRSPGILGRWMAESLVAPSREAFKRMGWGWEALLGGFVALAALVGVGQQVRQRNWWLALPMVYVLAFVTLWGTRYIPRYMVPVTPMVLLWLSTGTGAILARLAGWVRAPGLAGGLRRVGTVGVPLLVLLCNLPILAVEVYACHKGEYYATIRQGATAELIDAAAYVRRHLPVDVVVCTNDYIRRREVHLATGRAVAVYRPVKIADPSDEPNLRKFFQRTGARCAVIHYEKAPYPEWHFDRKGRVPTNRVWWGLYVWDEKGRKPVRIDLDVPRDRTWMLQVPDSAL